MLHALNSSSFLLLHETEWFLPSIHSNHHHAESTPRIVLISSKKEEEKLFQSFNWFCLILICSCCDLTASSASCCCNWDFICTMFCQISCFICFPIKITGSRLLIPLRRYCNSSYTLLFAKLSSALEFTSSQCIKLLLPLLLLSSITFPFSFSLFLSNPSNNDINCGI